MAELQSGVPASEVPEIVEGFIADGYTKIIVEKQSDGRWTITAEQ